MIIESKTSSYDYDLNRRRILIENLKRKYDIFDVHDYGSSLILWNFLHTIRIEIIISRDEIKYTVVKLNN